MLVPRKINGIDLLVDSSSSSDFYISKACKSLYKVEKPYNTKNILLGFCQNVNYIPLHLKIELTSKCNLNCEFCYIHNHVQSVDIEFNKIKPYFDYFISKGLLVVVLTGGECTLHPQFAEIYAYLKNKGVFVEIYTNGTLLNNQIIDLFKEYKPYRIEISLYNYNLNSDVYKNIIKLKQLAINVVAKCTVNKVTYPYFDDIKSWCKSNEIPFYFSAEIFDAYDGTAMESYSITKSQKIKLYKNTLKESLDSKIQRKKCFSCAAGLYSFSINSNYQMQPCTKIDYKIELLENSPEEALNQLNIFIVEHKNLPIENCTACYAAPVCKMCIARANKDDFEEKKYVVSNNYCDRIKSFYDELVK